MPELFWDLKAQVWEFEQFGWHERHDDVQPQQANISSCHNLSDGIQMRLICCTTKIAYLLRRLPRISWTEINEVLAQQVGEQLHEKSEVPVLLLFRLLVNHLPSRLRLETWKSDPYSDSPHLMRSICSNKSKGSLIESPTLGWCEVTQDPLRCLTIELQNKLHNAGYILL